MFKFVVWVVGTFGVLGLLLYAFAFDVWTVPADDPLLTASIAPTLNPATWSSRHVIRRRRALRGRAPSRARERW
jgi:hypothetical protein